VNQLHEEPDEAHDGETDGGRDRNLLEFCENKIKFFSFKHRFYFKTLFIDKIMFH